MEKISQTQLFMLYSLTIYGADVGFVLPGLSQATEFETWICLILGWALELLVLYAVLKLPAAYPDVFLTRFGSKLVGRIPHFLLLSFYLFYIMHIGASVLRELTDFILQTYLQVTPDWAVSSLFGLCIILAVRSGIETIFRCAEGFFFIVIIVVVLTPFLLTDNYNWATIGALLHHWNIGRITTGTIITAPIYSDITMVVFIYPHLKHKSHTFRTLVFGSGVAMLLTVMTLLVCLLLFNLHYVSRSSYPVLEMMRMIRVGDFLDNMDPFLIAIWMTTLFLKISLYLYIIVSSLGQVMGLKHSKPLAFSVGAIMIGYSIQIAQSIMEVQDFLKKGFAVFTYMAQATLLIYLIAHVLRGRFLKKPGMQAENGN